MRNKKPIFFVLSAIKEAKIASKTIQAASAKEAESFFVNEFGIKPEIISGPFFKKRGCTQTSVSNIKFNGVTKKAIYDGWNVTAQFLSEPENSAYLLFNSRVDGKDITKPKGHIIVNINNLRIYE